MIGAAGEFGARHTRGAADAAEFSALLEDSTDDLYENAPCGYLSTLLDGQIAKVNTTLLDWLGYPREELVGRRYFNDLLTVGGRLYHETHFAPLLRMQGEVKGIALELRTADGERLPVLLSSVVKSGADGQPQLIRTTVFDARDRRAYEAELLRARREAERERERLQRVNTILQRTLLPPALEAVPGLDVAAHYHIASLDEVGGDFYDLFPQGPGRWGFFLGDVCGKGAGAAALTSRVRYTLRGAAVHDPEPDSVLSRLNRVMLDSHHPDDPRFCTVLYGQLTLGRDAAHIALAGGGHPAALLLRADGSAEFLPTAGGQLIGVLPEADITTVSTMLRPGDTLLLYSDGLIEARTGPADVYGEEALLAFVRDLAPVTATELVAALRGLLAELGGGVIDDAALLALHLLPAEVGQFVPMD
ncbi:PP2C family protein-serine/threonine phosphatase [Nocardia asteroides]|uniref:PP2C family protein-serine/threonine phosphatase n=1 Tax=Nocardia asteroides TaxID=1824 RepID=UPI001E42ACC6|nr:SpoIIE family protein phosphatase [Nocardia asteroides]UGT62713.1 SpoIIE family protein phosphatase [Nocardia asteroides]